MHHAPAASLFVATLAAFGSAQVVSEVLATVDGTAVTRADVERYRREWEKLGRPISPGEALRSLVLERVLENRAAASDVTVPDRAVEEALERRMRAFGGEKAWREWLAENGSSAARERLEVRRRLVTEAFVAHCLGLVPGSRHLRPDLAAELEITPAQLRRAYEERAEQLVRPARVLIERWLLPPEAADDAEVRSFLERVRAGKSALSEAQDLGLPGEVASLALDDEGVAALRQPLRRLAREAEVGAVSEPIAIGRSHVVLRIVERTPARRLTFEEAQPVLEEWLRARKLEEARRRLALRLVQAARIWPSDLFAPKGASAQPVAEPSAPP